MISINMPWLQGIANGLMRTAVTIYHINAPGQDTSNRTGDDIVTFSDQTTSVMGWFVDKGTHAFSTGGGMSQVVDEPTLRVPVGTDIKSRDEVVINGDRWVVIDASADETWPVFVKAELARIE